MLHAIIMAGGSGTRFWPLSRQRLPKQFLNLHGDRSLLQQAYDRIESLVGRERVSVITHIDHVAKTREQLPDLTADQVIGEPCGRDTAACIGLGAALALRDDPDAHLVVLAADHLIQPVADFHAAINAADAFLRERRDALITFGIRPANPSTAYGYLRRAELASTGASIPVYKLASFHEKPDLPTAQKFLARGEFYWNSGIFCWRADTIVNEIERCAAPTHRAVARIVEGWNTPRRAEVFAAEYQPLTRISIDYAVMERSGNVYMVEAPFAWDDVGSWLALERVLTPNDDRNVVVGDHVGMDTADCVVVADKGQLVGTIGVSDLIIVHSGDVTLVARRSEEQAVKKLLDRLKAEGKDAFL